MPVSATTPQVFYTSGILYAAQLGEYEKGIEYFQKIVDTWPGYEFAWHAQFYVGQYYERLKHSGAIPDAEADPKIEQAYKAVLDSYPASMSASHAAMRLGQISSEKGQWSDAATYLEIFLKMNQGGTPSLVLGALDSAGRACERLGQVDKAKDRYEMFIQIAEPSDPRLKNVKLRLEQLQGEVQ